MNSTKSTVSTLPIKFVKLIIVTLFCLVRLAKSSQDVNYKHLSTELCDMVDSILKKCNYPSS